MQCALLSLFYSRDKFYLSRGPWNPTIHFEFEPCIWTKHWVKNAGINESEIVVELCF